ncbi:hypothetical protein K488DRAFT_83948 [Vararia minispora EC-137]|uniref:Uncharacterized protein n=1 Tax=Vararia minispora EC-137 TaxID=1314806 RepID=A0ACB8QS27_9AGAM|nr:hypothetical protein K488DRAFT_83948 [Vararia minispora EC-137]
MFDSAYYREVNINPTWMFAPPTADRHYRPWHKEYCYAQQPIRERMLPHYLYAPVSKRKSAAYLPPHLAYGWILDHHVVLKGLEHYFPHLIVYSVPLADKMSRTKYTDTDDGTDVQQRIRRLAKERKRRKIYDDSGSSGFETVDFIEDGAKADTEEKVTGNEFETDDETRSRPKTKSFPQIYPNFSATVTHPDFFRRLCVGVGCPHADMLRFRTFRDPKGREQLGLSVGSNYRDLMPEYWVSNIGKVLAGGREPMWYLYGRWQWMPTRQLQEKWRPKQSSAPRCGAMTFVDVDVGSDCEPGTLADSESE